MLASAANPHRSRHPYLGVNPAKGRESVLASATTRRKPTLGPKSTTLLMLGSGPERSTSWYTEKDSTPWREVWMRYKSRRDSGDAWALSAGRAMWTGRATPIVLNSTLHQSICPIRASALSVPLPHSSHGRCVQNILDEQTVTTTRSKALLPHFRTYTSHTITPCLTPHRHSLTPHSHLHAHAHTTYRECVLNGAGRARS